MHHDQVMSLHGQIETAIGQTLSEEQMEALAAVICSHKRTDDAARELLAALQECPSWSFHKDDVNKVYECWPQDKVCKTLRGAAKTKKMIKLIDRERRARQDLLDAIRGG